MRKAIFVLAGMAATAQAQVFDWNNAAGGNWNVAANWLPVGVPGSGHTANIGGVTPYTVVASSSLSIGVLNLTNALAEVQVASGTILTLQSMLSGVGRVRVTGSSTLGQSTLSVGAGSLVDAKIDIEVTSGTNLWARVFDASGAGADPILGPNSVISGFGRLEGNFVYQGLVTADSIGEEIVYSNNVNGGTHEMLGGGRLIWNARTFTNCVIRGQPTVTSAQGTLVVGTGVTFEDTVTVSGDNTIGQGTLSLAASSVFDAEVVLSAGAGGTTWARLFDSSGTGPDPILGPNSVVSGIGRLEGNFNYQGLVTADAIGEEIVYSNNVTGGTHEMLGGGRLIWNARTFSDCVIRGQPAVTSAQGTLVVGTGVTFEDTVTVSGDNVVGQGTLSLAAGSVFDTEVVLNAGAGGNTWARLFDSSGTGADPVLGPNSIVTGHGRIEGNFDYQGLVSADAPGEFLLYTNNVVGGTHEMLGGGTLIWNARTFTNCVIRGQPTVTPAQSTLIVGTGVTFEDTVTVSGDNMVGQATLSLATGSVFDSKVVLNAGTGGNTWARLFDSSGTGPDPVLGPNSLVTGLGRIDGNFVYQGLVAADDAGEEIFYTNNVSGGTHEMSNGGKFVWNARTFSDCVIRGQPEVTTASGLLTLGTGVEVQDPIVVTGSSAVGQASLQALAGVTIDADVVLNATAGGTTWARLLDASGTGTDPTIAETSSVSGFGRLEGNFTNAGTLAPGFGPDDAGEVAQTSAVTCQSTATMDIEIGGAITTEFDRITGGGTLDLAGTLNVSYFGGYIPSGDERLAIVSGPNVSGAFDSILFAQFLSPTGPEHVVYTPTQVLVVMCYADCDGNAALDFFDFLCFQNDFAAGADYGDCDLSGSLDFFDFLCFQNKFVTGCP